MPSWATRITTPSAAAGAAAVTGSDSLTSATQDVTGINVSSLPDGTLTFSVTLTNPVGNTGTAATATATSTRPPSGYSITADPSTYNAATSSAAGFTFANAEVGDTYSYTISSTGGPAAVTASGTVTSATQDVTGINVSSLPDGTLTFSVTLTNAAGNTGTAATATATFDQTAPSGYTITPDQQTFNATARSGGLHLRQRRGRGYVFLHHQQFRRRDGRHRQRQRDLGHPRRYRDQRVRRCPTARSGFSVTLTDPAGNTGEAATATATLDQTTPSGYSITSDQATYNATTSASAGFTFANAVVGTTYSYVVSSSGGGTAVAATGTVTSATQDVTAINVSSLPNGTLTFSVTLTNTASITGAAATATAILDQTAPSGYTITPDEQTFNATAPPRRALRSPTPKSGIPTPTPSAAPPAERRSARTGSVTSATQDVTGINLSSLPDGTLTFSVTLTDPAGNTGTAATATATLDQTTPSGYMITSDESTYNATTASSAGFTFANAVVGADLFLHRRQLRRRNGRHRQWDSYLGHARRHRHRHLVPARRHAHLQRDIDQYGQHHRRGGHGHGDPRPDGPRGYTITSDVGTYNALAASSAGFTIANAEVGDTYSCTISSSAGGTPVTATGTVLYGPPKTSPASTFPAYPTARLPSASR